ncbi:MAG TPA: hypothetical protein VMT89_17295 [Candidatus Acidoferrales bacterium]|nr:hypothetical protein [Candidatus Acidoferrales bacterium]
MNDALWTLVAILSVAAVHVLRAIVAAPSPQRQVKPAPSRFVRAEGPVKPPGASRPQLVPPSSPEASTAEPQQFAGMILIDPTGHCVYRDAHLARPAQNASSLDALLEGGQIEADVVLEKLHRNGKLEPYTTLIAGAVAVALSGIALRDRDDNFWGAALFLESVASATPAISSEALSRS